MSEKMIALVVTLVVVAVLTAWGVTVHYCCGWKHRRQTRRQATNQL